MYSRKSADRLGYAVARPFYESTNGDRKDKDGVCNLVARLAALQYARARPYRISIVIFRITSIMIVGQTLT